MSWAVFGAGFLAGAVILTMAGRAVAWYLCVTVRRAPPVIAFNLIGITAFVLWLLIGTVMIAAGMLVADDPARAVAAGFGVGGLLTWMYWGFRCAQRDRNRRRSAQGAPEAHMPTGARIVRSD